MAEREGARRDGTMGRASGGQAEGQGDHAEPCGSEQVEEAGEQAGGCVMW